MMRLLLFFLSATVLLVGVVIADTEAKNVDFTSPYWKDAIAAVKAADPTKRAFLNRSAGSAVLEEAAERIVRSKDRVVAIGDLHGDMAQTIRVLRSAGVIRHWSTYYDDLLHVLPKALHKSLADIIEESQLNANSLYNKRGYLMAGTTPDEYHWCAGKATVIFMGDAMDIGPDDLFIVRLVMRLQSEAKLAGGQVEFILGNHEVLQLQGNFDEVHPYSLEQSGGPEGRRLLLSMQTPLGRWLRSRPVILINNRIMYVHGGFTTKTLDAIKQALGNEYDQKTFVDELNRAVQRVLQYEGSKDYPVGPGSSGVFQPPNPVTHRLAYVALDVRYATNAVAGPLLLHPLTQCGAVKTIIDELGGMIRAQVVGHTPHPLSDGFVFCDGYLYPIDFGISRWKSGPDAPAAVIQFEKVLAPAAMAVANELKKIMDPMTVESIVGPVPPSHEITPPSEPFQSATILGNHSVAGLLVAQNDQDSEKPGVGPRQQVIRLFAVLLALVAIIGAPLALYSRSPCPACCGDEVDDLPRKGSPKGFAGKSFEADAEEGRLAISPPNYGTVTER